MAPDSHVADRAALLGVLLVTRSRPGPKLVFHFPPNLPPLSSRNTSAQQESSDSDEDHDDLHQSQEDLPHRSLTASMPPEGAGLSERLIFGHAPESLEKILSPGRWCDGKKFEVCLNRIAFVGYPVFSLENGSWSSARQGNQPTPLPAHAHGTAEPTGAVGDLGHTVTEPSAYHDFTHIPDSLDSQLGVGLGTSVGSASTTSGVAPEQLAMFHIIFALRSEDDRMQGRVSATYGNAARTFSKALHYCQQQGNYVTNESRTILALKAKARQVQTTAESLWNQILDTSELAWAIKEIYEKLCIGQVAGIRLNGTEMSLQMSLFLHPAPTLEPLVSILLLDAKELLLIELGHPDASPLAQFIRGHTPTKSLQKLALRLGMPINDVLFMAHHLLKWRKARIIAPLHQRNTYTVRPGTTIESMADHIEGYSRKFPSLPSLPNMLKVLSGKPIKYGMLIPSRDHRDPYMDILAYLVRHDLVTQLKSLGWLRFYKKLPGSEDSRPTTARRYLSSPYAQLTEEDDAMSVTSDRTTILVPQKKLTASPLAKRHVLDGPSAGPESLDVLILDPNNPTATEAKHIAAIKRSLDDEEFRVHFSTLLPFLDGNHPLEEIAPRLGLKRARVEDWFADLERRGNLREIRFVS